MGRESVVRIFYIQTKEYLRLWEEKNANKSWIEVKDCKQTKAFIGEEPNRWTIEWMGNSALVGLITDQNEVNDHRYRTGTTAIMSASPVECDL